MKSVPLQIGKVQCQKSPYNVNDIPFEFLEYFTFDHVVAHIISLKIDVRKWLQLVPKKKDQDKDITVKSQLKTIVEDVYKCFEKITR